LSALPLYMAMRFCMDALRASTACFSPMSHIIIAAMVAAIKPKQQLAIGACDVCPQPI